MYLPTDKDGQAYIRSPVQQLGDAFKQANELIVAAGLDPLRRLIVYCDTLRIPENTNITHSDRSNNLDLRIFARELQCLGDVANALQVTLSMDSALEIFTDSLPNDFAVNFVAADGRSISKPLAIETGKWGVLASWEDGELYTEQYELPMLDLSTADYLDRLTPDGTVNTRRYINDNLPRLVYYQFLVAASALHSNRKLSRGILHWVCNLSASPTTLALHMEACSLRNSLILSDNGHNVFHVPPVNIHASKQVLKSRLVAAKAFEDAFQNWLAQEHTMDNFAGLTANMLARSEDAIYEYHFLVEEAQDAYDTALEADGKARDRLFKTQKSLKELREKFTAGFKQWCLVNKVIAAAETLTAALLFIGAVAVFFAPGPDLAAPALALAGAEVAENAAQQAGAAGRFMPLVKRMSEQYKSLKDPVEALWKLKDAIVGMLKIFETPDPKDDGLTIHPGVNGDVLNTAAKWDDFRLAIDDMADALKDADCAGKTEYFHALRKLVIDGKTYLQTTENVCRKGNALAAAIVKFQTHEKNRARLAPSVKAVSQQYAVLEILQRAMFERLLAVRSLVFADFQNYSDAYMFHALTPYSPINVSPVQPVVDFLNAAAKLQGTVVAYDSGARIQHRRFTIHTLGDGVTDAADLQRRIKAGESVKVSLHPDNQALFQGFCRIRLARTRCYLNGAAKSLQPTMVNETQTLKVLLKTPGIFSDVGLSSTWVSNAAGTIKSSDYVGDARTFLFEYELGDQAVIVCDGEYNRRRGFALQTPLTEWEVSVAPGGIQNVDLDGLTGLKMEFWCDVTLCDP